MPPTPANLALLQVEIPWGYARIRPVRGLTLYTVITERSLVRATREALALLVHASDVVFVTLS